MLRTHSHPIAWLMEKGNWAHKPFVNKDVHLYAFIFFSWAVSLIWFYPRFKILLDATQQGIGRASLILLIFLIQITWLYGFYNVGIALFACLYRHQRKIQHPTASELPVSLGDFAVALLYPTCNDFVEASAYSCVSQDYPNFTVYILDDSTDLTYQRQVDCFANRFPDKVVVVRRPDRRGFKAGNLNHALSNFAVNEPFFAISDADEILPRDFLKCLVPILIEDEQCGFVQANHCCNPNASSLFRARLGIGIDVHWRWYMPLRNRYGFVMFLGHGAVLRRECWKRVGGFPEIVSEDLAYAIRLRAEGWYGKFAEHLTCYEELPESVRSFRIRHMKWTRGTCEFLTTETKRIVLSKRISLLEKFDILFPVMNLPFSTIGFPLTICVSLILWKSWGINAVGLLRYGQIFGFPTNSLKITHNVIWSPDFLIMAFLVFIAPVLHFILDLYRRPFHLLRFLCYSFVIYAGLFPLSIIGVLAYLITRKATFFVTGDLAISQSDCADSLPTGIWQRTKKSLQSFLYNSHPDHIGVKSFEVICSLFLVFYGFYSLQFSLVGLAFAFLLQPVMHNVCWENKALQRLIILPYPLAMIDILVRGLVLLAYS